jgi:hypothetical protein
MNNDDRRYIADVLEAYAILEASDLTADERHELAQRWEQDVIVGRRAYGLVMPPRCLRQG